MTPQLETFMQTNKEMLENGLSDSIQKLSAPPVLKEAMQYSVEAGGKRIRPLLLFATLSAFGKEAALGHTSAMAVEMIHTYSLIHDDLPSMDDDDLRRGKPTNHKVFGEAMAILAGDGLLTYSFQLIADDKELEPEKKAALISLLAKCAGPEGMVGGQVADIQGENSDLKLEELEYIHNHKTGKLLLYSILAGALIAGADSVQISLLRTFAAHLGLAFQISDDILDVEGDENIMGKPVGSDTGKHKSTYPGLLSVEGAKNHLALHIDKAKAALKQTGLQTARLEEMTDLLAARDR